MFKYALLAASLAIASTSVNAELVSYDWLTEGDGDVSLDTETGLLWLDLDVTGGLYYNSVDSYLENDSRYEGFRFATADEVRELADNLFPEDGTSEFSFAEQLAQHRLMGNSYEWNGGFQTGGFYKDESAGVFSIFSTKHNTYDITQVSKSGSTGVSSDSNLRSAFYGHYVVATDASVSIDSLILEDQMAINNVPLYGGAVAIGLFGLFANRKKKAKAI